MPGAETAAPHGRLEELALLSPDAAAKTAADVMALADGWTRRHPIAPFFTLGAAAYLDATPDPDHYLAAAARTNPVLAARFAGLFATLTTRLSAHLDAPVHLTRRFALPGFHIYLPFAAFRQPVASLHWDRQHALLSWGAGGDPTDVLSLTLPLACPAGGCGLRIWHFRHEDGPAAREKHLAEPGPAHLEHDYRPGRLILHDGQDLHQAVLMPNRRFEEPDPELAGDRRITLQAHLAKTGGGWELYW